MWRRSRILLSRNDHNNFYQPTLFFQNNLFQAIAVTCMGLHYKTPTNDFDTDTLSCTSFGGYIIILIGSIAGESVLSVAFHSSPLNKTTNSLSLLIRFFENTLSFRTPQIDIHMELCPVTLVANSTFLDDQSIR